MNNPQLKITQIRVGNNILWQDPVWAYQQMTEAVEKRLTTSDFKEAKELINRITGKK